MLDILLLIARLLLAAVFVVAGITKLADRAGSRDSLIGCGLPRSLAVPFGLALPVVELVIAVTLIPTDSSWWGALGALALLLLFIAAIGFNLARDDGRLAIALVASLPRPSVGGHWSETWGWQY